MKNYRELKQILLQDPIYQYLLNSTPIIGIIVGGSRIFNLETTHSDYDITIFLDSKNINYINKDIIQSCIHWRGHQGNYRYHFYIHTLQDYTINDFLNIFPTSQSITQFLLPGITSDDILYGNPNYNNILKGIQDNKQQLFTTNSIYLFKDGLHCNILRQRKQDIKCTHIKHIYYFLIIYFVYQNNQNKANFQCYLTDIQIQYIHNYLKTYGNGQFDGHPIEHLLTILYNHLITLDVEQYLRRD